MGMYGALVVRPRRAPGPGQRPRSDSAFNPANEYLFLLSEIDPEAHLAVERGGGIDWTSYKARYFLINGRSMPDTLAPNNASWLPNQPYGALVHIRAYDAGDQPAARDHPLPQRRHRGLSRSTRTAATSGSSTRTGSPSQGAGRAGPVLPQVRPRRAARPVASTS